MATKAKDLVADGMPSSNHPNPLISNDKLKQLYSTLILPALAQRIDNFACVRHIEMPQRFLCSK